MTYEQVLSYYGTAANIARAFDVRSASVAAWKRDGVPEVRQYQIEIATKGKLKADKPAMRDVA